VRAREEREAIEYYVWVLDLTKAEQEQVRALVAAGTCRKRPEQLVRGVMANPRKRTVRQMVPFWAFWVCGWLLVDGATWRLLARGVLYEPRTHLALLVVLTTVVLATFYWYRYERRLFGEVVGGNLMLLGVTLWLVYGQREPWTDEFELLLGGYMVVTTGVATWLKKRAQAVA